MKYFAIIDTNEKKQSVSAWVVSSNFAVAARFLDEENCLDVNISPFTRDYTEEESVPLCYIPASTDQKGFMSAIRAVNEDVSFEIVSQLAKYIAQTLSSSAATNLPETASHRVRIIDLEVYKEPWSKYLSDCIYAAYKEWVDTSPRNPSRYVSSSSSPRPKTGR